MCGLQVDAYNRTWRDTTDLLSCVPRNGFADTAKAAMVAMFDIYYRTVQQRSEAGLILAMLQCATPDTRDR